MWIATTHPDTQWLRPWFFAAPEVDPLPPPAPGTGPALVPDPEEEPPKLPGWVVGLLAMTGVVAGVAIFAAMQGTTTEVVDAQTGSVPTVVAETSTFTRAIRIGGTVGATNFAMIRAPRMEGGRDRGGGGGLIIETLAEAGTIVEAGDVVAEFESKRTQDILDDYASNLAQTRSLAGTRKAEILIATETLRQTYRTTKAEAEKAALDLQTAEVRSAIQAEIFDLTAQEGRASTAQLENEVRLQEEADRAERRSLEISVEQDQKRMSRTESDLDKMRLRTPVGGLVVIETMFSRGSFQQASPGDQVYGGSFFMRVVDLSNMAVYAQLNQADSQLVKIGAPVKVRLDAYPDVVFDAEVQSVGAMAVNSSSSGGRRGPPGSSGTRGEWIKQVPVSIAIQAVDERIKPDLSASGDVIIEQIENALVVPRAALATVDDNTVVWLQEGASFMQRPVQVGSMNDTEAVILSGLQDGDMIAAQAMPVSEEGLVARR